MHIECKKATEKVLFKWKGSNSQTY